MRIHVAKAAVATFLLSSLSAFAADPVLPEVEAYDWTGFYVGVHGGFGWGETEGSDPALVLFDTLSIGYEGDLADYDIDGWLGGGQAGYQIQRGQFVLGVEADISATGIEGDEELLNATDFGAPDPDIFELGLQTEIDWLATFRARAGVTFDRFLVYATAGLAVGEVESGVYASSSILGGGFDKEFTDTQTHLGWTAGAGIEALLTQNISLKAEYLFVDLGEQEYDIDVIDSFLGVKGDADITLHTLRAGLNYRF